MSKRVANKAAGTGARSYRTHRRHVEKVWQRRERVKVKAAELAAQHLAEAQRKAEQRERSAVKPRRAVFGRVRDFFRRRAS